MMQFSLQDLLGGLIFQLPLITLISWGLFRAFYRGRANTRAPIIIGCCVVVTALMIYLYMAGTERYKLEPAHVYDMIAGLIAMTIGLLVWGKAKPTKPPTDASSP